MYTIQNIFHVKQYFSIKVTPFGPNLCLLEGQEDRDLEPLVEEGVDR